MTTLTNKPSAVHKTKLLKKLRNKNLHDTAQPGRKKEKDSKCRDLCFKLLHV